MKTNPTTERNMNGSRRFLPRIMHHLEAAKPLVTISTALSLSFSSTALFALGSTDARSLIDTRSLEQQQSSSQDLNSLRQQLQDKTKELEEYKSKLFRASHPEDQSKIVSLSRRIAEYETGKQKLNTEIQKLDSELATTRRQLESLESASKALSTMLEGQRAAADVERNDLLAKIRRFEEDRSLENEKALTSRLQDELASLRNRLAENEKTARLRESQYEKDLQDILQETAMLKFELADIRKQTQEKEQELQQVRAASDEIAAERRRLQTENRTLNDTIARHIEAVENLERQQQSLALKLIEREEELASSKQEYQEFAQAQTKQLNTFKERVEAETQERLRLQEHNERTIAQHDLDRQALNQGLADKEELLKKSADEYQLALGNYMSQISELQNNLNAEKAASDDLRQMNKTLTEQYESEKNNHQQTYASSKDLIDQSYEQYRESINQYMGEIQKFQAISIEAQAERQDLLNEKDQLAAEKSSLERMFAEKEQHLSETIAQIQSHMTEDGAQTESLRDSLAQAESAREKIHAAHEQLQAEYSALQEAAQNHLSQKEALEIALREKEEAHNASIALTEASIAEHQLELETLKNQLAQEEEAHQNLQNAHKALADNHEKLMQTLTWHELEKDDLLQDIATKEAALAKAGEDLLSTTIAQHRDQLADLEAQLAQLQNERTRLLQGHDDLKSENAQLLDNIAEQTQSIESMAREIAEKEAALSEAQKLLATANAEHQEQLDALQDKLAKLESNNQSLQLAYDELTNRHDEMANAAARHNADKEDMTREIAEKEALLRLAHEEIAAASAAQHDAQIDALQNQLLKLESDNQNLQQAYEELTNRHDEMADAAARYNTEKESLTREIAEKEALLRLAHEEIAAASSAQHDAQIDALQNQLLKLESDNHNLQQAYEELTNRHDEMADAAARYNSEKEALTREIAEKETSIRQAYEEMAGASSAQHGAQIDALQSQLMKLEADKQNLQQAYEELTNRHNEMVNAAVRNGNENEMESINSDLAESLQAARSEMEALKQRISAAENERFAKENDFQEIRKQLEQQLDRLKEHADEQRVSFETLMNEKEKLSGNYQEKVRKEQELEKAVESLTLVAQHQDQALAEANSTFSLVQDYNRQLENENVNLKNRLNELELVNSELKKSLQKETDVVSERTTSAFHSALLNLMHHSINAK